VADRNPVGMEEGRNPDHPAAHTAVRYKTYRVRKPSAASATVAERTSAAIPAIKCFIPVFSHAVS
jgi:hypothetical protein